MTLESGTYINSLDDSNPAATDSLSQADDHIRLIKATIKATFPSITGAVTATHTALNAATPAAITTDGSTPSLASGITAAEVQTLIGVTPAAITSDGSTPSLASGITAAEVRTLVTVPTLLEVYPVGAIYMSVVSTSPATLFGGTWAALAAGKVLVGLDASDTDFDTAEETGGAKTHTLSIAEMPAHTHDVLYQEIDDVGVTTHPGGTQPGDPTATIATQSTGGGGAHNNLQPYLVAYMWKRTA
mgnify:CR=1 FL=1